MARVCDYVVQGVVTGQMVMCPACGNGHLFNLVPGPNGVGGQKPVWTWDGDRERPTFSPSMLCQSRDESGPTVCHSFVRDGRIEYLGDCTHAMAGQTVELADWRHDGDAAPA